MLQVSSGLCSEQSYTSLSLCLLVPNSLLSNQSPESGWGGHTGAGSKQDCDGSQGRSGAIAGPFH
jgi:hypothetical protein